MKKYKVGFSPKILEQFLDLRTSIAEKAGSGVAKCYTAKLKEYCKGMATFPERRTMRNDLHSSLRMVTYRHRIILAFTVRLNTVTFQEMFHAGQDVDALLAEAEED